MLDAVELYRLRRLEAAVLDSEIDGLLLGAQEIWGPLYSRVEALLFVIAEARAAQAKERPPDKHAQPRSSSQHHRQATILRVRVRRAYCQRALDSDPAALYFVDDSAEHAEQRAQLGNRIARGPMTEDDPKVKKPQAAPERVSETSFTTERIERLLKESVRGAEELDENLKRVFDLSGPATRSLR